MVDVSEYEGEDLPPLLAQFKAELQDSRRKLLKEKDDKTKKFVFSDPEQLRQFVGQFLYPQIIQLLEVLGRSGAEVYQLTMSNAQDVVRLRQWATQNFQSLGVDAGDADVGMSLETLNEVVQALYVLGSLLQARLPQDKEVGDAFNAVTAKVSELFAEVQAAASGEEEDEEEGEEEESEEEAEPAAELPAAEAPGAEP